MFAIPWHGHTVVGTTDTALAEVPLDPVPSAQEIDFILETAEPYLQRDPTRDDILSTFAGVRPLARAAGVENTAELSRDHAIHISPSGLVTVAGGKWTTYRHMAEDCVNQAALLAGLPDRPCVTRQLDVHGYHRQAARFGELAVYGADAPGIEDLVRDDRELGRRLHPRLPIVAAQVVWAARCEMARTVDDVLSRRTRALFLDARAAADMAPATAHLLARELGRDEAWESAQLRAFAAIAATYLP
jgi:glycerol-3-phosphate dehydrogenase